jgi:hypothetical protein
MNLAIAATNNMETWQVDYVAAYFNSNLKQIFILNYQIEQKYRKE